MYFFGIVLVKSEAVSWYHIFEMFMFKSFHMFRIIGNIVIGGVLILSISKQLKLKFLKGGSPNVPTKDYDFVRYLLDGTIFGVGWALCDAYPGPMYILVGTCISSMLIVIIYTLLDTFIYGILKNKLLH